MSNTPVPPFGPLGPNFPSMGGICGWNYSYGNKVQPAYSSAAGISPALIYLNTLNTINGLGSTSPYILSAYSSIYTNLKTGSALASDITSIQAALVIKPTLKVFIGIDCELYTSGMITSIFTEYNQIITGIWCTNFDAVSRSTQNDIATEIYANGGVLAFTLDSIENFLADTSTSLVNSASVLVINDSFLQNYIFQPTASYFNEMLNATSLINKFNLTNALQSVSVSNDTQYQNLLSAQNNLQTFNTFLNSALFFGMTEYATSSCADYYFSGSSNMNNIPSNYIAVLPNQLGDTFTTNDLLTVYDVLTLKSVQILPPYENTSGLQINC